MTDQGAYMFKENNKLCLMIFAKLPKSILQKTLPFEDISNSDYLQALFIDGRDYLCGCNKEQINLSIIDKDMKSINDSSICLLSNHDEISRCSMFAERQLQDINSEIIKYQNNFKIFGYSISKKKSKYLPISLVLLGTFYLILK